MQPINGYLPQFSGTMFGEVDSNLIITILEADIPKNNDQQILNKIYKYQLENNSNKIDTFVQNLHNIIIKCLSLRAIMDFLSDSEPENPDSSHRDLQRLQAAWNNVKEKRQSEKKSVTSMKNAIHQQQQKNLEARLIMTEKQLSKARENTALLMKKLSEAEQELEMKEFELGQERKIREQRQDEIEELKALLAKKNIEPKHETFGLNKENFSDNTEIENLKKSLQIKQKQIDRLCLKMKSFELDRQNHENQLRTLQELNESYRKRLSETQYAMNQVYLGQQSKGAQLLQLSQAKKTIQRLVTLLRTTQQFKNFIQFTDDSKQVHYLKNITKRLKSNGLNHKIPERKKLCSCMDIKIDEKLLWTPEASYRALLEMKIKYDSLSQQCIEEVLFQLNKIWLAREENRVRRLRQNYENDIAKLKKKAEQRYDELVARKQIQRLKKELSGAKNCCTSTSTGNTRKCSHKGAALMENLKQAGQYEDQIKIKAKEIKLLQERIRLLNNEAGSSDRALYLQGTLWAIQKILKELECNDEDMREFQTQFRSKIHENVTSEEWLRSFKQFFETLTQINNSLIERLFNLRESTLKKVSVEKNYNTAEFKK